MSVRLYQCYAADRRLSMDIYADRVFKGLQRFPEKIDAYRPESSLEKHHENRMVMRYLRYVDYPRKAAALSRKDGERVGIQHVVDHGYAHLAKALKNGRRVISAHDLIPILAWKGYFGQSMAARKPRLALYSARFLSQFDKILASSEHTANDLINVLGIDSKSIEVTWLPLASGLKRVDDYTIAQFRQQHDLSEDCFVVLLTGNEFYKNHVTAAKAIGRLLAKGHRVKVLHTSKSQTDASPLDRLGNEVVIRQFVHPSQIAVLYSAVDALLFPSLYEGFGFPVAEALACGTPVVCSNAASLPEVGGEIAQYADAFDDVALANHLERLICEPEARLVALEEGPRWVQKFSSEAIAQHIHSIYDALLHSKS